MPRVEASKFASLRTWTRPRTICLSGPVQCRYGCNSGFSLSQSRPSIAATASSTTKSIPAGITGPPRATALAGPAYSAPRASLPTRSGPGDRRTAATVGISTLRKRNGNHRTPGRFRARSEPVRLPRLGA